MTKPVWLSKILVLAIHGRLLAEHGGSSGLRDQGLLESALVGPKNHVAYANSDIFDLAGVYAHGIIKNHPFVDGNKRTALAAAGVFLELNGFRLMASEADAVYAVLGLSRGDITAVEFGKWLRRSSVPLEDGEEGKEA